MRMAELQLRSLTADDRAAVNYLDELAFGFTREPDEEHVAHLDVMTNEYAIGVFDETELVGCGGAFPLDVTVPGGASLPCPGITMIAVKPTHRRRGALTTMMRELLDRCRAAGQPIAALTASEAAIYGRYGFGRGTSFKRISVDAKRAVFVDGAPPIGDVRMITADEARDVWPELHERCRAGVSGMMRRSADLWAAELRDAPGDRGGASGMHHVVHRSASGQVDGAVAYRIKMDWRGDGAFHEIVVKHFAAESSEVGIALWRFLCSVDLVGTVVSDRPTQDPLREALTEPRIIKAIYDGDHNWLRILDPVACFAARRYLFDGGFVVGFEDPTYDDVTGNYRLDVVNGTAQVARTDEQPDLTADAQSWASVFAGDVDPRALVATGRAVGDADRAARFFAVDDVPYSDVGY